MLGSAALGLVVLALATRPESFFGSARAEDAKKKPNYVSLKNCKLCHSDKKTGDQHGQWTKTKHAKAYETLGTAKAKELAAKAGVKDPQKDIKCLKCHVTGAETPELSKKIRERDGVQCESCHGAGEFYAKQEVFDAGREAAVAKGLVIPDEKLCVKCHNKESPTFPGKFDFEEMWKKILHPNPAKKK